MHTVLGDPKQIGWGLPNSDGRISYETDKFWSIFGPKISTKLQKDGFVFLKPLQFVYGVCWSLPQGGYSGFTPTDLFVTGEYKKDYIEGNQRNLLFNTVLGRWANDPSNCGVGGIHVINNMEVKGIGVAMLYLLEKLMYSHGRKYIHCTINQRQRERDCGKFLERHGYKELDTFIGGNSYQLCSLYVKNLTKTPIIKLDWDKLEKL